MATPTSLPATFVAGDILTAAQMNNLRGAFRVLQVVSATYNTATSNSTTTYANTGLSVSITPSATSSKVLVLVAQNGNWKSNGNAGNALSFKLVRDSTDINFFGLEVGYNGLAQELISGSCSAVVLDSPATTSAVTYKTMFANRVAAATVTTQLLAAVSSIIVCEISA